MFLILFLLRDAIQIASITKAVFLSRKFTYNQINGLPYFGDFGIFLRALKSLRSDVPASLPCRSNLLLKTGIPSGIPRSQAMWYCLIILLDPLLSELMLYLI